MGEWQDISTAPKDGWVWVSMRDVERPQEWVAKRIVVPARRLRPSRELWIAKDDGLVCAPTHWLSPHEPPTASPDTASVVSEDQHRDQSSPRPDGP